MPIHLFFPFCHQSKDATGIGPLTTLAFVPSHVEENCLHVVVQAPTNGEPISVFLHITDNLIGVVQRAWVPKTQEKRRGKIGSLSCIKVRVFFLLLPSFITKFQNVISRILKVVAPADSAKSSNHTKSHLWQPLQGKRTQDERRPSSSIVSPYFWTFLG